ncbi:MAG: ComEA family DNA-binding protein [Flavobacteriales bacterium]
MKQNPIKIYFTYSRSERIGIIVLLLIIAIVIAYPFFYDYISKTDTDSYSDFDKKLSLFIAEQDSLALVDAQKKTSRYKFKPFDPNHLSDSLWAEMGFSVKQASVFHKHIAKRGLFCSKHELQDVYIVDSALYADMFPFIEIKDTFQTFLILEKVKRQHTDEVSVLSPLLWKIKNGEGYNLYFSRFTTPLVKQLLLSEISKLNLEVIREDTLTQDYCCEHYVKNEYKKTVSFEKKSRADEKSRVEKKPSSKQLVVELNSATQHDLKQLKGIGDKLSERIIKYREKLGGFISVEQLSEVYGIEQELLTELTLQIRINNQIIRKIKISEADFKTLVSHPYIDKEMANRILNCKKQGNASSLDRLKDCLAPSSVSLEKIFKYLE